MDMKRLSTLVPLVAGFAFVAAILALIDSGQRELWLLLEIFALLGVVGWQASRQHSQPEQLSHLLKVDQLTGLHNYSYFIDRLAEERMRADRFGSRLALIMIDIDHFKPFNEKYGQQKGDELLKHVTEILKAQVRGVDIVSRYGGEEFAILLPNTGPSAAEEVTERIRVAVETSDFATTSGTEICTISVGIATYPADAEDDLQLIDRADAALLLAKEAGRNRVVTFSSDNSKQKAIS